MGYCVEATFSSDFRIPAENVEGAISALTDLMCRADSSGSGGRWSGGEAQERWFSWVETSSVLQCLERQDLAGALKEWRYDAVAKSKADLEVLSAPENTVFSDVLIEFFEGSKWGDDEELWCCLAPFVSEGSTIEWVGEDHEMWKYVFTGGGLKKMQAQIVWS